MKPMGLVQRPCTRITPSVFRLTRPYSGNIALYFDLSKSLSVNISWTLLAANVNNKATNEKEANATTKVEEVKEEALKTAEKGNYCL